jgi:hypothetical protein
MLPSKGEENTRKTHKEDSKNKDSKHKDLKEDFQDYYTKNQTKPKTSINRKNPIFLHWRTDI